MVDSKINNYTDKFPKATLRLIKKRSLYHKWMPNLKDWKMKKKGVSKIYSKWVNMQKSEKKYFIFKNFFTNLII